MTELQIVQKNMEFLKKITLFPVVLLPFFLAGCQAEQTTSQNIETEVKPEKLGISLSLENDSTAVQDTQTAVQKADMDKLSAAKDEFGSVSPIEMAQIPEGGKVVVGPSHSDQFTLAGQVSRASHESVKDAEGKFPQFHKVAIHEPGQNSWDIQLQVRGLDAIEKDDVLFASFWLRAKSSSLETGEVRVGLTIEEEKTYHKVFFRDFTASSTWVQYLLPIRATRSIGPVQLNFALGEIEQIAEIAEVQLLNFGPEFEIELLPRTKFTYEGRAADAVWRSEALARIEKHRKADLKVSVVDSGGNPVGGAKVHVKMQKHAFYWGADVADALFLNDDERGQRFREILYSNFNYGVPGQLLKWGSWESKRERAVETIKQLQSAGMKVKAHCIIWPSFHRWGTAQGWDFTPRRIYELRDDPDALRLECEERVTEQVSRLAGMGIESYDVVNEPFNNNDIMRVLGEEVMFDWYRKTRELDPDAILVLNEAAKLEAGAKIDNLIRLSELFDANDVPLDALGVQAHYGISLTSPVHAYETLERLAKTGKDIQISEFDMPGDDQELHADYLRDFMIIVFSHPSVTQFIQWGFTDAAHWRAKDLSGLWNADLEIKPAGEVYRELLFETFWTDESLETNASGVAFERGFLGDYLITIEHEGQVVEKRLSLTSSGSVIEIQL